MDTIYILAGMDIRAGQEAGFVAAARACQDAVAQDPAGTQAYEWFLSDDRRSALVIEAYDDAEALGRHIRVAGAQAGAIRAHADSALEFAGGVPEPMLDRMRERLGEVGFAGPRFLGRMEGPTPAPARTQQGQLIAAIARFSVHAGKQEEFRALAQECFDKVVANEPGTLGYEWFLSEEGRECLTIDLYADADALKAHMANAGPVMARIIPLVDAQTAIYGAVPDEVRSRLKPELGTKWGGRQLHGLI